MKGKLKANEFSSLKTDFLIENLEVTYFITKNLKSELGEVFNKYASFLPENLKVNAKVLKSGKVLIMVDCLAENVFYNNSIKL